MNMEKNRGFVLVFAVLLLLTMTLVGISLMSSSQMQERMAGNARLQTVAMQAASAGVAGAIEFVNANSANLPECGTANRDLWENNWDDDGTPITTEWQTITGDFGGSNVTVESRIYCLWGEWVDEEEGATGVVTPRSQAFVESRAKVFDAGGDRVLAERSVEVRLRRGQVQAVGDDICATQSVCDGNDDFNIFDVLGMPSSGAFTMGGDDQHAMCVCSQSMLGQIEQAILDQPNGNFEGINGSGLDAFKKVAPMFPWDSVENVLNFTNAVRSLAQDAGGVYHGSGFDSNNADFGTRDNPQVTYINGDFKSGGNPSGAGILVVNGDFEWSGNGQFDGLVVVLGENYTVTGGGNGGVNGTLVFSPIVGNDFGTINVDFHKAQGQGQGGGAGGGNATYQHDCDILTAAEVDLLEGYYFYEKNGELILLKEDNGEFFDPDDEDNDNPIEEGLIHARDLWQANCQGGEENIFLLGPNELQLVSWRENLGWREQADFFSTKTISLGASSAE